MTFKLEFPADDIEAMLHFGKAMVSIAASHGCRDTEQHAHIGVTSGENTGPELTANVPDDDEVSFVAAVKRLNDETVAESLELPEPPTPVDVPHVQPDVLKVLDLDDLDAHGLPWDTRIHSKGKTKTKTDEWRIQRKPKDQDQATWDNFVTGVIEQIKQVDQTPPPPASTPEPVTGEVDQTPPPPASTPEPVTGEVKQQGFVSLLNMISTYRDVMDREEVTKVLKTMGINSIPDISSAEPALVNEAFYTLELLGKKLKAGDNG